MKTRFLLLVLLVGLGVSVNLDAAGCGQACSAHGDCTDAGCGVCSGGTMCEGCGAYGDQSSCETVPCVWSGSLCVAGGGGGGSIPEVNSNGMIIMLFLLGLILLLFVVPKIRKQSN